MAETLLTLTGTEVTVDESAGLQTSGVPTTTEDNNDSDVTALSSAIATQLATAAVADSKTIPGTATGFAVSNGNVVTVNSASLNDIAFTDSAGAPLNGADSGLTTLAGNRILLFSSAADNNIVYGIEENTGDLVFALILEETQTNGVTTGAKIWTALYEPISHTVDGAPSIANHDDPLDLTNKLYVTASEDLIFNFDQLPSGSNLFDIVGTSSTAPAIVVIGENIDLDAPNNKGLSKFSNTSDVIHTSQGGTGATIGVNNQLFDNVSEGAYFTYVNNPVQDFLSGAPGGLTSTEADYADNIQYTGGTLETTTAFFAITQMQGNNLADVKISAFDVTGSPQGLAFVNGLGTDTVRNIDTVRIFSPNDPITPLLETSVDVPVAVNGLTVDFEVVNGQRVVTIFGLNDNYRVEWDTDALHDRVLIENVNGQFDIGLFGLKQVAGDTDEVGSKVNFEDDGPSVSANSTALLDDDALAGGNAGGTGDDVNASNLSGNLGFAFGTDGAGSIAFLTTGAPAGFTYELSGTSLLIKQGGTTVVTVTLNTTTGAYTVAQNNPILHAAGLDENNQAFTVTYRVTDGDGDTADGTLGINVDDDTPTVSGNATALLDDDALAGGNAGGTGDDVNASNLSGNLGHSFGADGAGSIAFLTTGAPAGFTYELSGTSLLIKQGITTVVTVTLNTSTGAYTVTQNNPILHAAGLDENNQAFTLNYRVTDADGDTADGTLGVNVDDDTPTIGPIANSIVDFAVGSNATKSLVGSPGADDNSTYTITAFEDPFVVNGVTVNGVLSPGGGTVNFFGDDDGVAGVSPGDTLYYTLALDQTDPGAYTFTVHVAAPPAELEFNFDELPSGANLFGVVGPSSSDPAIVVIGENIELNAPDNKGLSKYSNDSDVIHTSQGGTGATIGVNNQLFDNVSEGAYFTYVNNPVQNFLSGAPGGLTSTEADYGDNIQYTGGTLEVGSAFFAISQMQGNNLADVKISAWNITGAPQALNFVSGLGAGAVVDIETVRIFSPSDPDTPLLETSVDVPVAVNGLTVDFEELPNGQRVVSIFGLDDNYKVEWDTDGLHDRVLIENVSGQFDIGRFGISQPQPTPDQKLDFTVQISDNDGDTASANFSVGIDGTGPFDDGIVLGV